MLRNSKRKILKFYFPIQQSEDVVELKRIERDGKFMKKIYLTLILGFGMFAQQGWSPPPGQGGAAAAPDIKSCDLKPQEQTKITLTDKSGKKHFICTGMAACGESLVPVSCKISEREPCPVATKCLEFDPSVLGKSVFKRCDGIFHIRLTGLPRTPNYIVNLDDFGSCVGFISDERDIDISGVVGPWRVPLVRHPVSFQLKLTSRTDGILNVSGWAFNLNSRNTRFEINLNKNVTIKTLEDVDSGTRKGILLKDSSFNFDK